MNNAVPTFDELEIKSAYGMFCLNINTDGQQMVWERYELHPVGTLFVGDKGGGKNGLLVSWGSSNKLPGTGWFETIEIYSLTSGGWKAEMKVLAGLHSFQSL